MSRRSLQSLIVLTSLILSSLACSLLSAAPQSNQTGTIKIVNMHIRGSDFFPGGKNLPDTREYGVCIVTYPPNFPASFFKPTFDTIMARDAEMTTETIYELPTGTYTLQEWQFDSEVNNDPMYSPEMKTLVRPTEIVMLDADAILDFGSTRSISAPGEFVEGTLVNSNCGGAQQQSGNLPTSTPEEVFQDTEELPTNTPEDTPEEASPEPVEQPTNTLEPAAAGWVLKLVQPDVGKNEVQFSYPGLACDGGTKVQSTETNATTTTTGTCQVNGALVANQTTQHTWTRPADNLQPGQEMTGTMTASSSGLCSWQSSVTEESCANSTTTSHTVWQGDGWPGGSQEFAYTNLVYGNDYNGTARASNNPTGSFDWKVPDGSMGGGKTLVLQFCASSGGGKVYTNFWYEWAGG